MHELSSQTEVSDGWHMEHTSMDHDLRMAVRPERFGFSVMLTTIYLLMVAVWLVSVRRISPPSISKLLLSYLRKRYHGKLETYIADRGHCFMSPLPSQLISDEEGISRLVLLEDGVPLSRPHSAHDDIRTLGAGRYSHWGAQLFFSASDNSNPTTNKKTYEVFEK